MVRAVMTCDHPIEWLSREAGRPSPSGACTIYIVCSRCGTKLVHTGEYTSVL